MCLVGFPVTMALAAVLHIFVEQPFLRGRIPTSATVIAEPDRASSLQTVEPRPIPSTSG